MVVALLARTTIVDAGRNCRKLKSVLEKSGELRVVSLGGGPGSDVLGFCSALSELGQLGWTSLHITVVDAVEEWRECVTLVDQYLREDEFGSVSRLFRKKDVSMSFVRATLPGNPEVDAECYDALKNADLIIECKFLFRLDFLPRNQIIKALRENIKDDALVLPIHAAYYDQCWKPYYFEFLYAGEVQEYQLSDTNESFDFCDDTKSNAHVLVVRKR